MLRRTTLVALLAVGISGVPLSPYELHSATRPDEQRDFARGLADADDVARQPRQKPADANQSIDLFLKSTGSAGRPLPPLADSRPLSRPKRADSDLASQIKSLIAQYLGLRSAGDIQVAVESGIVLLEGSVSNAALKPDLENRIAALSGVVRVDDQIIAANE